MADIWKELYEILQNGKRAVLVTVLESRGSAPRGAGAKMLVQEDGRSSGSVGGGAVEFEAQKLAVSLFSERKSCSREFSLTSQKAADLGMICGGDVLLYFQYIEPTDKNCELFQRISQHSAVPGTLWILLHIEGQAWELSLCSSQDQLPENLRNIPLTGCAGLYKTSSEEYYLEPLSRDGVVYVFGGGHVAQALVPLLSRVEFSCVVMDDREQFACKDIFPQAQRVLLGDFSDLSFLEIQPCDFVVIMTRGHQSDYIVLSQALRTQACYIGMMGSRRKIESTFDRLREDGFKDADLKRVFTPIGLPIQAETPEEIAVSVAAEMILRRSKIRSRGIETMVGDA